MVLEEKFKQITEGKYPYIRFKDVTVDKTSGTVCVTLSAPYERCDALSASGETEEISGIICDIFKEHDISLPVTTVFKKVYFNADIIKRLVEKFLSEQYGAYCSQIPEDSISATVEEGIPIITLDLPDFIASAFISADITGSIKDYISELYGVDSEIVVKQHSANAFYISSAPKLEAAPVKQYFHSTGEEMAFIGDKITESAVYIARVKKNAFDVCIAGTVSDMQERVSKKGYYFHTFKLDDTTGSVECIKFTRRKKGGVLGAITNGMTIKVKGSFEEDGYSSGQPKFIVSDVTICNIDYSAVDNSDPKTKRTSVTPVPVIPYQDSADSLEQVLSDTNPLIAGKTYIAIDFETTGKNPSLCSIIEIGMARMVDGKVTEYFDTFVNPGIPIPPDASRVNHIFDADVKDAPRIEEVLPQVMEFIGDVPLIAHNGNEYDYLILARVLKNTGMSIKSKLIDTLQIANDLHIPGRHNLSDLCTYFHIPLLNAHRAYADCIATAKLYAALVRYEEGRKA